MGEASWPGGQRRSVMTAAAVGVGGLVLWRGHPARAQVSSVVHASGHASFIAITSVHPCLLRTRDGLAGWGGGGAEPTLPSRGPNEGLQ